jgi:hypothetical protein
MMLPTLSRAIFDAEPHNPLQIGKYDLASPLQAFSVCELLPTGRVLIYIRQ